MAFTHDRRRVGIERLAVEDQGDDADRVLDRGRWRRARRGGAGGRGQREDQSGAKRPPLHRLPFVGKISLYTSAVFSAQRRIASRPSGAPASAAISRPVSARTSRGSNRSTYARNTPGTASELEMTRAPTDAASSNGRPKPSQRE